MTTPRRRAAVLLLAALAPAWPLAARADDPPKAKPAAKSTAANAEDDEAAALPFVREHHPELASLLSQLKPMRPDEYRKAVRELAQVSRSLAAVKEREPRRYRAQLEVWKTRSRVELLAARLASWGGPSPDLESQLRTAVAAQIDAEIALQQTEKDILSARVDRIKETIQKLESRRDKAVESRVDNLLKKAQKSQKRAEATVGAQAKRKTPSRPAAATPAEPAPAPGAQSQSPPNQERTK